MTGPGGKLLSLAALTRWRAADLEADFQQFYGLDLGGLYRGELSPWRAARLTDALPPEARIRRGSSVNARWMSLQEQLLTALVNHIRILAWQNTKDGQKGRNAPDPIPTPEEALAKAKTADRNAEKAKALKARLDRRRRVG